MIAAGRLRRLLDTETSHPKRSISDAIYAKRNPGGDPFTVVSPSIVSDAFLFGLGTGIYWGEGSIGNGYGSGFRSSVT